MFVVGSSLRYGVFVRLSEKSFQPASSRLSSSRNYAAKYIVLKQGPKVHGRLSWSRNYFAEDRELQLAFAGRKINESLYASIVHQVIKNPTCEPDEYGLKYFLVMLEAMCVGGRKAVEVVPHSDDMHTLLNFALKAVTEYLDSTRRSVSTFEETFQIGRIAANGDEMIGELVAKAIEKIGAESSFILSEGHESHNELEFFDVMTLSWRLIPPYFIINQKKKKIVLTNNPLVLVCAGTISNKNVVEQAIKLAGYGRPLLIVAEDVEDKVVGSLILEKTLRTKVYIVRPSELQKDWKATMEDLAIFTGGQVLTETIGINFIPQMLGSCKAVTMHHTHVTIYGGSGNQAAIEKRCEQLKSTIKLSTSTDESELLEKRLKNLSSKAAVIKVKRESLAQARKALEVVRAAVEGGVLPGAGVALLHASKELDKLLTAKALDKLWLRADSDGKFVIQLFQNALKAPAYKIAATDGFDGSLVVKKILQQDNPCLGYDPIRGECIDVIESGVYDLYDDVRTELTYLTREFERGCWPYYVKEFDKVPGSWPVPQFH